MPRRQIDRDKLRMAIRRLGDEYVYYMLDEALELLPDSKLAKLAGQYLDLRILRPDSQTRRGLPEAVRAFEQASLRGDYYESFFVNSKNCMDTSMGTRAWIAECRRLLDRCVAHADDNPGEARTCFETIFGLLHRIDECQEDIIFFADEAGSWQVGVHWERILPVWFACLAPTATPEEYAQRVDEIVTAFVHFKRDKFLAIARQTATQRQREALEARCRM